MIFIFIIHMCMSLTSIHIHKSKCSQMPTWCDMPLKGSLTLKASVSKLARARGWRDGSVACPHAGLRRASLHYYRKRVADAFSLMGHIFFPDTLCLNSLAFGHARLWCEGALMPNLSALYRSHWDLELQFYGLLTYICKNFIMHFIIRTSDKGCSPNQLPCQLNSNNNNW